MTCIRPRSFSPSSAATRKKRLPPRGSPAPAASSARRWERGSTCAMCRSSFSAMTNRWNTAAASRISSRSSIPGKRAMIESINREIAESRTFLVTTHESPDGDAVGSTLALAGYLRKLGKEVTVYYRDPLPDIYTFLPFSDLVQNSIPAGQYEVCFVLDVGELN